MGIALGSFSSAARLQSGALPNFFGGRYFSSVPTKVRSMQVVWKKLAEGQDVPTSRWMAVFFGAFSALGLPVILVLFGFLLQLLFVRYPTSGGERVLPAHLQLGDWIRVPTTLFSSNGSLLGCAIVLILLMTVVFAIERWTTLLSRRASLKAALYWNGNILNRLFGHSRLLSVDQGLSGQRSVLRELIQTDLPKVRETLTDWCRVFPRSVIQVLMVLLLACMIQPWLTLLAILGLVAIWWIWGSIETSIRKERPVLLEQRRNAHEQLIYLCESSPILESVDARMDVQKAFDHQLEAFHLAQYRVAEENSWRSPILLTVAGLFGAFLFFVTSLRVLDPESDLRIGDMLVLVGCVAIAVNGIFKIRRCLRKRRGADHSANAIASYLAIPSTRSKSIGKGGRADFSNGLKFEHVSFRDSSNARILDDVTLELAPGKFTALVSLDNTTSQALGEMLLGFGMPTSGRVLIDQNNLIDIDPASLRNQTLLINERGPLLDGSVEENIWSGAAKNATIDILEIAKKAKVSEAILNLPEGLGTVLTSNDERLTPDQLYRLGIVRALLKRPSVVVAHEPRVRVTAQEESDSLEALNALSDLRAITVVLPERLSTLRRVDQIVMFKDGKIAASGTHSQLLEQSELYRHYNYIRFAFTA